MPDYVYLPYQCKRPALDFIAMAEENTSLKHTLYFGDPIQRSHFCGHLWPAFHQNPSTGSADHQCDYTDDVLGYHRADKSFVWTRLTNSINGASRSAPGSDNGSNPTVRFSQRFVANDVSFARKQLEAVLAQGQPVSHLVANIGMWFGQPTPEAYAASVYEF